MFVFAMLSKIFSKINGQICDKWDGVRKYLISPCTHHKIVLLVALFVFAVGFRLLSFSLIRLWLALSFCMTDNLAVLFRCLCVS